MPSITILVLCILVCINRVHCGKIVGIFAFPSQSHVILGRALLKELASRGHEVTMVSSFPSKEYIANYKDIDLKELLELKNKYFNPNKESSNGWSIMIDVLSAIGKINHAMRSNEDLIQFVQTTKKADVFIIFAFAVESFMGLAHKMNASSIIFSPMGSNAGISFQNGNPSPFSYVPTLPLLPYSDQMEFKERVINTLAGAATFIYCYFSLWYQQVLISQYYPDSPSIYELLEDVNVFLINSHFSTETPRPYLPGVVQIGGYHLYEKLEKLPQDLQQFLDQGKEGVIYFSLGSNMDSNAMPSNSIETILKVFGMLPYKVLWKDDSNIKSIPPNVKRSKWLPQRSLLAHPNVKLFITHAGFGSFIEAIFHAVPMLCLPVYGDQAKNSADSVKGGYALELDLRNVTKNSFRNAIEELLHNPKYLEAVKKKQSLFRDQEMNPMDKAVYWVEHVIKYKGSDHLKGRAKTIPLYQYLLLDVLGFLLMVLSVVMYVSFKILKLICSMICCRSKTNENKLKNT